MKHVIIGTAGHVDHGKTLLVKALTGIDTLAAACVERQEEGGLALQIGAHVHLVQIHGEVCQTTCLELQQTGLRITLVLILTDGILVILTAGITLQLKSEDGNTV